MRRLPVLLVLCPLAATAQTAQPEATLPDTVVQARRLDAARNAISPTLGAQVSTLKRDTIENLPQGGDAPINQLLLQFPGAVQDSFGEIHVRGEHRNLQYRLNGVTLPEGIQGFASFLDARAISSLSLLTGALPAQFGYRTGGVVDITLRSGATDPGGFVSAYGGSFNTFQPSAGYAGTFGGWDVFGTGSFRQSRQGIEPPTAARDPIHNRTDQLRGLVNVSRLLDDSTRISVIAGASANRFQFPNNPGQAIEFPVLGQDFDSGRLRARQWERNQFAVIALQGTRGAFDWQVAGFGRNSSTHYLPDVNELAFNGIASEVRRRSAALGLQADGSYMLNPRNTLRFGVMTMGERTLAANNATVLPLDINGDPLNDPFGISTRRSRTTYLHGVYVQNEFRVTNRFTINAGLRGDYADQAVQASQLSPRINAVWRPLDGTTLTVGYARYFTPPQQDLIQPSVLGLFANTTGAPANSDRSDAPRPERSHYFSAGLTQRVTERVTVGSSAWYKDATDMLDLGQFGRAIVFTPFNYRQGQTYGVDFTGQWRSERLDLYANLTVSRATGRDIRTSQFAFDAAELDYVRGKYIRTDHDQLITASAGAIYRPWDGGRISGTMLYGNGLRRGFANTEKQPTYATFNLGIAQDFRVLGSGTWTARLDVLNVADRQVQLRDGSGIGVGAPQFIPRRGVFAGLSRTF